MKDARDILIELADPEEQEELLSQTIDDIVEQAVVKASTHIKGQKGDKGDKGERGERGERGPKGDRGERGAPGFQGPQGKKGDKGDKGQDGKDGKSVELKQVLDVFRPHIDRGGGNMNRNIWVNGNQSVLSRYTDINLKPGSNVTIAYSTNDSTRTTDITFSSSGGGGSGYQTATGTVDGSNTVFSFSTAPNVIVVDQSRIMQQTSSDGTVNWTGTTTVTLAIAPNFDIYGVA